MHPRSWLLVPGDAAAFDAAASAGADAVVADLRGGVDARAAAGQWLAGAPATDGPKRWAVVSPPPALEDDLQVLLRHGVDGILVPKATNAALFVELDHILGGRGTRVAALVETAVGLLNAGAVVAVDRVSHLVLGEAPLGVELGLDPGPDEQEWSSVRGHLVLVSVAFGKLPPTGSPPPAGAGDDVVRASSDRLRRLGYGGRLVTDRAHVAIVNDVFAIADGDLARAEHVWSIAEKALANGEPVLDDDGRPIDDSEIVAAHRLIQRAR